MLTTFTRKSEFKPWSLFVPEISSFFCRSDLYLCEDFVSVGENTDISFLNTIYLQKNWSVLGQ